VVIGVYAVALLTPFASIEQAIPSLVLATGSGISAAHRPIPAWSMAGGKLRFRGKGPAAVSALDTRGRLVAWLRGEQGPGSAVWELPAGPGPVFFTARCEDSQIPCKR
jgi:hypothetical protein